MLSPRCLEWSQNQYLLQHYQWIWSTHPVFEFSKMWQSYFMAIIPGNTDKKKIDSLNFHFQIWPFWMQSLYKECTVNRKGSPAVSGCAFCVLLGGQASREKQVKTHFTYLLGCYLFPHGPSRPIASSFADIDRAYHRLRGFRLMAASSTEICQTLPRKGCVTRSSWWTLYPNPFSYNRHIPDAREKLCQQASWHIGVTQ